MLRCAKIQGDRFDSELPWRVPARVDVAVENRADVVLIDGCRQVRDLDRQAGRGRRRDGACRKDLIARPAIAAIDAQRAVAVEPAAPAPVPIGRPLDDDLDGGAGGQPVEDPRIACLEHVEERRVLRRRVAAVAVEDGTRLRNRPIHCLRLVLTHRQSEPYRCAGSRDPHRRNGKQLERARPAVEQ